MRFERFELPFDGGALEPFLSRRTLDDHHQYYVRCLDELERLIPEGSLTLRLHQIADSATGRVFNLAAEALNHEMYWQSLSATSQAPVDPELAVRIIQDFGSLEGFFRRFAAAARGQFAAGWIWLALDRRSEKLDVLSTRDAMNPRHLGYVPLLALDLWEHAYFLDYQHRRDDYVEAFLRRHLNWRYVEANLRTHLRGAATDSRYANFLVRDLGPDRVSTEGPRLTRSPRPEPDAVIEPGAQGETRTRTSFDTGT